MPRGQTLFYTDAVIYLRSIYPIEDYIYHDDFPGSSKADLLIIGRNTDHLILVEIKSEKEIDSLGTKSGNTFKALRGIIHGLELLKDNGKKNKDWICVLAQCWDYMQSGRFPDGTGQVQDYHTVEDILVLPSDKRDELVYALEKLKECYDIVIPNHTLLDYPSKNTAVLIYKNSDLDSFFNRLITIFGFIFYLPHKSTT